MAEITRLSVGKALDMLRRSEVWDTKRTQLDEQIIGLDQELESMRAAQRRIARDQAGARSKPQSETVQTSARPARMAVLVVVVAALVAAGVAIYWALAAPV